jgi:hypothetical protein
MIGILVLMLERRSLGEAEIRVNKQNNNKLRGFSPPANYTD